MYAPLIVFAIGQVSIFIGGFLACQYGQNITAHIDRFFDRYDV